MLNTYVMYNLDKANDFAARLRAEGHTARISTFGILTDKPEIRLHTSATMKLERPAVTSAETRRAELAAMLRDSAAEVDAVDSHRLDKARREHARRVARSAAASNVAASFRRVAS